MWNHKHCMIPSRAGSFEWQSDKGPIQHQNRETLPKGICCSLGWLFFPISWAISRLWGTKDRSMWMDQGEGEQKLLSKPASAMQSLRFMKPGYFAAWGKLLSGLMLFSCSVPPSFLSCKQCCSKISPFSMFSLNAFPLIVTICCDAFGLTRYKVSSLQGPDIFCSFWEESNEDTR